MLLPQLEPFRGTNFLSRINRAFKPVVRELNAAGVADLEVDVQSASDASRLKNLFTFKLRYEPNQWLSARGTACGFDFCVTLPFRNGVTLPYWLEIDLESSAPIYAELRPWITPRGRWFTDPLDARSAKRIKELRLPSVAWTQASGGLKHRLNCGGFILPPDEENDFNRWTIHSAYQGFFPVRPQIIKYLSAADRLEALLKSW